MDYLNTHFQSNEDIGLKPHLNSQGETIGFSQKNIFGGQNYYDSHHQFIGYTADNILGGHDYLNSHGMHLGQTIGAEYHDGKHNFINDNGNLIQQPSGLQVFQDPFTHDQIHEHFHGIRQGLLNQIK